MSTRKKIIIIAVAVVVIAILVFATVILRQIQEAPAVYASITDGSKATCVRGNYTWNYFGGSVIGDAIDADMIEYENINTLLVKPEEQITFSNSDIDFTSYKCSIEELKYYDMKDITNIKTVDKKDIYQDVKHFTIEAPVEDGTYIYSLNINYYSKGKAEYYIKIVVSSDPTYEIKSIIKYKDTYIGNAPNVSAILNNLPYARYKDGIVLRTVNTPYELIVTYKGVDLKKADLFNNTVALFALIKNVDIITYNIEETENSTIVYTRDEIEAMVGRNPSEYAENTELWIKEVFYKETGSIAESKLGMYKIIISDAVSSVNGLLNNYVALDMESFDSDKTLTSGEKKKILSYASTLSEVIIEANLQGLKDQGLCSSNNNSISGTLISVKTITNDNGKYTLTIEKYKSERDITEMTYEAQYVNNQWVVTEK